VQNMPGAGGIKAANYVYTVAPKDGTALGTFSVGALIDELFGTSTTSFDTAKFGWIGNMDESVGVCVVKAATGVRKFEDLLQKEVLFGGTGPAGGVTQAALALTRLYGAKIKLIKGYPGAQDVVVAMDRGEVHGVCGISIAVLKSRLAHQIKSGELVPIIHDAMKPHRELPGVPSVYDFARSDDERKVLDLLFGWRVLGRPLAAPPGIPPERLAALRKAFTSAMNDKRFVADAAKAQLDIAPASGEQVATLIARMFSHSKDTIKRAADTVRN
jgi:tripartite-type tricarboxylate transporter receptor subunit TctC